jgi:hypothetical protein
MYKILVDKEEVVCEPNFEIKEEFMNPSSIILDKVYPKSWKGTNRVLSDYYFPKDYSKCLIYDSDENLYPYTVYGETTQEGTPTPDSPKPIINKAGTITETIEGLPYQFNLGDVEICKINDYKDRIFRSKGVNLLDTTKMIQFTPNNATWYSVDGIKNFYSETQIIKSNVYYDLKANNTYTFSVFSTLNKSTSATTPIQLVDTSGRVVIVSISQNNTYTTFTTTEDIRVYPRMSVASANVLTQCLVQLQLGNLTPYEPYNSKGKWYIHKEIGKVVLDGSGTINSLSNSRYQIPLQISAGDGYNT